MKISRRLFIKGCLIGTASAGAAASTAWAGTENPTPSQQENTYGCLADIPLCVGCRKCEAACNEANRLPPPERPFEDKTVMDTLRRPDEKAYTVVNKYVLKEGQAPIYVKVQCMHCTDPACVSACIVGALTRDAKTGAVVYDPGKCIGCRYCMVACPFQIPAYEYFNALDPQVRKCTFCQQRIGQAGGLPACVKVCPEEALLFGRREDLLQHARRVIANPGSARRPHPPHIPYVYGEHEVGGTAWMYLSSVPFEQIGFLKLPKEAPPRLTEKIQHGVFKFFIPPLALYTLLGAAMHLFRERAEKRAENGKERG